MIESHDSDNAAFEVGKGRRKVMVLSEEQVERSLDPTDLLRELDASFGALARGEVQCPPRSQVSVSGRGFSLTMAAWQPGMQISVKVVNVFLPCNISHSWKWSSPHLVNRRVRPLLLASGHNSA
ncbi:MAG: hypothetical protein DMG00_26050 [Acidobacteria bacterium]|nr:MAG: hypothetical protein DMG00_26050 [Acidobacteriota bacterium]